MKLRTFLLFTPSPNLEKAFGHDILRQIFVEYASQFQGKGNREIDANKNYIELEANLPIGEIDRQSDIIIKKLVQANLAFKEAAEASGTPIGAVWHFSFAESSHDILRVIAFGETKPDTGLLTRTAAPS